MLDCGQVIEILAHHLCYQLETRQLCGRKLSDQLTVSKNRNLIADRIYLLQEMGYENDSDALIPQLPHQGKQLFYFIVIQGRGRLIQDQNLCGHIHRARDGNHLLDRNGIMIDRLGCFCVYIKAF